MSLNKPEINYDTALYALQENVVLKQRLEDQKEEHDKIVRKLEVEMSEAMLELGRTQWSESNTEEKLGKALDDVAYLQNKLEPIAKQRDKALGKMYAAMVLVTISFCLDLYLIFNCYTWS